MPHMLLNGRAAASFLGGCSDATSSGEIMIAVRFGTASAMNVQRIEAG
jgi:hypothetical protein